MSNKFQNEDFKNEADLIAKGGTKAQLLNTTKTYSPKSSEILEAVLRKNNDSSATNPTATDDSAAGYEVGSRWIDTAAGKIYHCVSNSVGAALWKEGGSGGGDSDVDSLIIETYENSVLSDFTHVGLVLDDTTLINGLKSAKLIHSSVTTQYFKKAIPVPPKFRNRSMTVAITGKSTATSGNVTILFRDETNAVDIQTSQQLNFEPNIKTIQLGVKIPETCLSFSYKITALNEVGSPETVIDDLVIRNYWVGSSVQGQTEYQYESIEQQKVRIITSDNILTNTDLNALTKSDESGSGIFTLSSSGITALKKCTIDVSISTTFAGAAVVVASILKNGVTQTTSSSQRTSGSGVTTSASSEVQLDVGDIITVFGNGSTTSYMTISATALVSKTFITNDLVPAKAMNGSASIDVPKITTHTAKLISASAFTNSVITGVLTNESGTGNFSYNSGTGVYTVLKKAVFDLSYSVYAISSYTYARIYIDGVISSTSGTYAVATHTTESSLSIELDVGQTFNFYCAGTGGGNNHSIFVVSTAYETETKTWSSTQTLVEQEQDSQMIARGNGGEVITAGTEDIAFAFQSMKGDAISFSGTVVTFLKDGFYNIDCGVIFTAIADQRMSFNYTQNGVGSSVFFDVVDSGRATRSGNFKSYFYAGDTLSVRSYTAAGTLSNNTAYHYLNVTYQGSIKAIQTVSDQKIEIPTHELRFEGASSRGSTATSIVKFDSIAKIRGDAFEVVSNSVDGTYIRMLKAGRISVGASVSVPTGANVSLSKNQTNLTGFPIASEYLASSGITSSAHVSNVSWSGDVAVNDIIRVSTSSNPSANGGNNFNICLQEQKIAVSVSNTLPQFSESDSAVDVRLGNGYGSTNTLVRRFSNVLTNLGSDIEYLDSSINGASFTIKTSGIYSLYYSEATTGTGVRVLISKNQTDGANSNKVLASQTSLTSGEVVSCSNTVRLEAGDVIRAAVSGTAGVQASTPSTIFTIAKIGKPNVTGVDVTPFIEIPQPSFANAQFSGWNGTNSAYQIFDNIDDNNGNGIFSVDVNQGHRVVFLKAAYVNVSFNKGGHSLSNAAHTIGITKNGSYLVKAQPGDGATGNIPSPAVIYNGKVNAGDVIQFFSQNTAPAYGDTVVHASILAQAVSDQILTEPETFSTDTASLQYAGSSQYTLATLKDSVVGTFITGTYTGSNALTQTNAAPPSQTIADMNANGIRIYNRISSGNSTAAQPAWIAINIGKALKGVDLRIFKDAGKADAGSFDYYEDIATGNIYGCRYHGYNPTTGIYIIAQGNVPSGTTASRFLFVESAVPSTNPYVVINASKNPALVGLTNDRVYSENAGNAAQVITANVTDIPFIGVSDTHGAWNGSQYIVPEDGVYNLTGTVYTTTSIARNIYLYENGAQTVLINESAQEAIHQVVATKRFSKGTVFSIRSGATMTLSSASAAAHWLTITKVSK